MTDRVTIPGTGIEASRLCMGTMTFGSQVDEGDSLAMVEAALEAGIDFFDTANVYNRGVSEQIVGKAMKGRRDRFVLATKVRGAMGEGPEDQGLSKPAIRKQCEASLRRLDTDYIDFYYLHMPDRSAPIEETLEALDELVSAGKIRQPAVSNYAAWQLLEMNHIAKERNYRSVKLCQPMYSLLARNIEAELLPMCTRHRVATFVYNPLAGGLLTGKQPPDAPMKGSRFDGNRLYLDRYWHQQQFDAVAELRRVAEESGRSLVSIALNWILRHTPATGLILGASRMGQLKANLAACQEGPLDAATLEACDTVWKRLRGITPDYIR